MNTWMESGRRAAADLFPGLASHLWSSTIFLLAVLAILWILRRRLTAAARFSLVLIGLAKFALPHAAVTASVQALDKAFRIDPQGALGMPLRAVAGALRVDFAPAETRLWPAIVLGVWAAVALVLILRLAWAHHRLSSLLARTALPPRPREAAALARARQRTGAHSRIGIARSPLPEAPAVLGVRRPLIVLPLAGCDDLSEDELESLLRHECAHVVRRDNLVAGCASVLCSLFWFHPLVWIARRILMLERERACDEMAVGSGEEGEETYLTALAKFCHAAIGPELPGVSRMATAQIKERIDHIMRYPTLKTQSPSPFRAALLTAAALALFTLASGLAGSRPLAFADGKAPGPYAIRMTATRAGATIELTGSVRENATQTVIAAPALTLDASRSGDARSSAPGGVQVALAARPDTGDQLAVEVTIEKSGAVIQKTTLRVTPSGGTAEGARPQQYTGDPIDLSLKEAELRDVLITFGQITGLEMRIDEAVQGKVSISWHNVPWDEALDSIVRENGLTYRIEGKTIRVSKR
jgi:beta-lactamase regulating signal transducer with metallopeptidase domain